MVHKEIPVKIDHRVYARFHERNNVFGRMLHDPEADYHGIGMYERVKDIVKEGVEGYTRTDFARVRGAWAVYEHFSKAFRWDDPNTVMDEPLMHRCEIEDKAEMSRIVKETAITYGACKVGITEMNEDWLYSHDMKGDPIEVPDGYDHAIVMLVKMDREALRHSPSMITAVENGSSYSKMAFLTGCMAQFIRALGYRAIPMGNDTALSIPLAVQAGLGDLGRNGLLITPEFGPSVKICKVFTDLPLEHDEPVDHGIREYCVKCKRCARTCEAGAIQLEDDPSFHTFSKCNNQGILRWAVNMDECYKFWIENGGDCSTCITRCPFTK